MKYPTIPRDERKSTKLKMKDRRNVRRLFHIEKWTIPNIADLYKVTNALIYWILNPDKYKIMQEKSSERSSYLWRLDKDFKKRSLLQSKEWRKEQRKTRPEYKKYVENIIKKRQLIPEVRAAKLKKQKERYERLMGRA